MVGDLATTVAARCCAEPGDLWAATRRPDGAALGDEQLQQAYARGKALSFDQAISLALGESLPTT
jgi:hypothetical protein